MKLPKHTKSKQQRSRAARPVSTGSSVGHERRLVGGHYNAYAVEKDGSRRRLNARNIVVEIGGGQVVIELEAQPPLLRGQLYLRVNGLLILGHGDASSVYIGVEQFGTGKSSRVRL
jgi:hypothetical protein